MASHSQFKLLTQRRFAPLFWTQFLGTANDNVAPATPEALQATVAALRGEWR